MQAISTDRHSFNLFVDASDQWSGLEDSIFDSGQGQRCPPPCPPRPPATYGPLRRLLEITLIRAPKVGGGADTSTPIMRPKLSSCSEA
jgi:hypothetical protein